MREDESIIESSEAAGIPGVQTGNSDRKQLPYYLSWYRGIFGCTCPPEDKPQADGSDEVISGSHSS
jgi:hypothetical protein